MGKGGDDCCSSGAMPLGIMGAAQRSHPKRPCEDAYWLDMERGAALVADGMGGHHAGGEAAHRAADYFKDFLASLPAQGERQGWAEEALLAMRSDLTSQQVVRPDWYEADATAAVALMDGDMVDIAWCGDSRVYRWDGQELELLTLDHSAALRRMPEDSQLHATQLLDDCEDPAELPRDLLNLYLTRNHVSSGIGAGQIDHLRVHSNPGDQFILCSDGLHDNLTYREIKQVLSRGGDPASNLMSKAFERSGELHPRAKLDDITVLVLSASAKS